VFESEENKAEKEKEKKREGNNMRKRIKKNKDEGGKGKLKRGRRKDTSGIDAKQTLTPGLCVKHKSHLFAVCGHRRTRAVDNVTFVELGSGTLCSKRINRTALPSSHTNKIHCT